MILRQQGNTFKLDIVGYEYPNSDEYYDANWIVVKIDVVDGGNHWSAEDKCLQTYELADLVDWLNGVKLHDTNEQGISFLESEISFRVADDYNKLQVVLDFNFHPKGLKYIYGEGGDEEYVLEFDINELMVQGLISNIKKLAERFPERLKS